MVASTEHAEAIVYSDIDLSLVEKIRNQVPVTSQRRHDLYEIIRKNKDKDVYH